MDKETGMNYRIFITVEGKDATWTEVDRKYFMDEKYILLENDRHDKECIIVQDLGKFKCTKVCEVTNGFQDANWYEYANDMKKQYREKRRTEYEF